VIAVTDGSDNPSCHHASSIIICVTVLVVVIVTVVVVIKLVTPPCRMVSVLEMGGFFTTCSRRGTRSRQYVLMLFASFVRKSWCFVSLLETARAGREWIRINVPVLLRSLP
jgi:hypothetical protein